ncbi:MAG: hypothetical protein FWC97_00595 [Treponema sp.]|nr:hypothetical protein [Treponema sp.]
MKKNELTSKDLLLVLLYCPGLTEKENEPITGRTRLTKMVFLFEKEIKGDFFKNMHINELNFESFNFGPYSKELFDNLKFFLSIRLIRADKTSVPISIAEKYEYEYSLDDGLSDEDVDNNPIEEYELKYSLSKNGMKYIEDNVWELLSNNQKNTLIKFKKNINSLSLDALLKYVYNKYKEYTNKSKIADKYIYKENPNV